jgi:hypothetical protein
VPTESPYRGARKVNGPPPSRNHKKSRLPTYPNFKPVYTTASSLLDYDNYDDYREEAVTLPPRHNTVTATTARPQVTSTTTPTYYPTSPSIYTSSLSPTPSASGLLDSPVTFATFTKTTTPPYTTNKLYITTPKPSYVGPWSSNYFQNNFDRDLDSSPSEVIPSDVDASSKSSKITTYRPNGFSPTSLNKRNKKKTKTHVSSKSIEESSHKDYGLNTSSLYADQSDLGLDYYDYYYDAALDYLQGRISQLNSKNNNNNNSNSNNKYSHNHT